MADERCCCHCNQVYDDIWEHMIPEDGFVDAECIFCNMPIRIYLHVSYEYEITEVPKDLK